MKYSVDTSSLSNGWVKLYPPDIFPGLWEQLDDAVHSGIIVATEEVLVELERGDADLYAWAKARKKMFVAHDAPIQVAMADIVSRYSALVDVNRMRSMCDPWVIAVAREHGLTVVTEENSKPSKPRIPDVCSGEGIPCIRLLEMIRELGWRFGR